MALNASYWIKMAWQNSIRSPYTAIITASSILVLLVAAIFYIGFWKPNGSLVLPESVRTYSRFFYASFLKPHTGGAGATGQQAALESFYVAQADVYDATRRRLLLGREDMLGLVAAQLKYQDSRGAWSNERPIWVDIGGGTGHNIQAMEAYLDVPTFFSKVYLVDFSPSLCEVARKRFIRLGWNVKVVCQDARSFRLEDHVDRKTTNAVSYPSNASMPCSGLKLGADLITMSYSLSMIPDYYSVVDSLSSLLSVNGLLGVVDFYVQSIVETSGRNYTGATFNRHVNWLGRVFWRAWFDVDRVGLEGARRDYLEYRFGTLKTADKRNYMLGGIPYYIFLGRRRHLSLSAGDSPEFAQDFIELQDAVCTESPYLSPRHHRAIMSENVEKAIPIESRSKAYQSAIINLSSNLPLPSAFYQNAQRRIYYNDQLRKHAQFKNEYIYAFTWEDPRVDHRLLKIRESDVVLCVTSAGDNALDYLLGANPRRIHTVDLNPNQNHLLELKIAALQSLPYEDVWRMFGEGKYPGFRQTLISRLSPHMSSQAFQFWLEQANTFTSSHGLYETGGSRHAIKLVRRLSRIFGLRFVVRTLCQAKTLNEQREIWPRIRRMLMSRALHWTTISTEWFAWKAAGVPPAQRNMIVSDHLERKLGQTASEESELRGDAIWEYMVNTFDPVVQNTLMSHDNYFYLLCLQGQYSRKCHPEYLTPRAHAKLSRPNAFDGLRMHTDELKEVITRIASETLTIAVIMDSMDWFDPSSAEAKAQVRALNKALKLNGKVLLRSAGMKPWYISVFEASGFSAQRVAARHPGACIDRVNMYASTWLLVKIARCAPFRKESQMLDEIDPVKVTQNP